MRTPQTIIVLLLAAASTLLAQTTNPVVSYAYIGTFSSSAPRHTFGFAIHADGSTTTVPGSPFAGVSGFLANTSNFVFATDEKTITTYHRSSTGSLTAVASIDGTAHNDTPSISGVGLLTLDRTGATLYAGEQDFQGPSNNAYAEFTKLSSGKLSFLANTAINVNDGGELTFTHNNAFAYIGGCSMADWTIVAFHRASNGELTRVNSGNNFPPDPNNFDYCPAGMSSSARGFLATGYSAIGLGEFAHIIVYRINSSGTLMTVSTKGTIFRNINSMRFEPTGNFLAVAGDKGIAIYQLTSSASLSRVTPALDTGVSFKEVRWDNSGHLLARTASALYVFSFKSGALRQVGSPRSIANAMSLAVTSLQ